MQEHKNSAFKFRLAMFVFFHSTDGRLIATSRSFSLLRTAGDFELVMGNM